MIDLDEADPNAPFSVVDENTEFHNGEEDQSDFTEMTSKSKSERDKWARKLKNLATEKIVKLK